MHALVVQHAKIGKLKVEPKEPIRIVSQMVRRIKVYKVFIGYSSEDKKLAQYIHDCLIRIVQIQPHLAEEYLNYGEDFKEKIMNELDNSSFMVILLTDNGTRSQMVNQEVGYAYALKKRLRQSLHLIPISESQTKLKGFITKDSIDIMFSDKFSCFEDVVANIIFAIRRHIPRGLEKGGLTIKMTCSSCTNGRELPFEYEIEMVEHESIFRAVKLGKLLVRSECPQCHAKNDCDIRTTLPYPSEPFKI